MSSPTQLSILAQLILSNDSKVVETAASLLYSLVSANDMACCNLYSTGVFYFGCRHTGSHFQSISRLFSSTHLRQSFHTNSSSLFKELSLGEQSILGNILPEALLNALVNYSPEIFCSIFTGHVDSPEFIWSAVHRTFLVQSIDLHIGVFLSSLRQFSLASYEYVPIPKIHYPGLEKELYVHEYYLRNLCDEEKFPNWPISDPLQLLHATIERWREEMQKGVVDAAVTEARAILHLKERYTSLEVKSNYRNLARKYHPDKNPTGRDYFERIKIAYELLCSIELEVAETDLSNVLLLIRTQNIVYQRFPDKIGDQQYPAYELLMSVLHVPSLKEGQQGESSLTIELLELGTLLVYYTCAASEHNAAELVALNCVPHLHSVLEFFLHAVLQRSAAVKEFTLLCMLRAFAIVSQLESGVAALLEICPSFVVSLVQVLKMVPILPLAAEISLAIVSNCSLLPELQNAFLAAGIIWKLIPLILVKY